MAMNPEEAALARDLADFLSSGDERIATTIGTATLHAKPFFLNALIAPDPGVRVKVSAEGKPEAEYVVELVVRRVR